MTSDSPFGELAGIRKAREIVAHTATLLEELAGIGDGVIGRYSENVDVGNIERRHKIYTAIEAELADALPDYDAAGLQDLVIAYSNKDDSKQEAITRGMYTGALASVLTQRNNKNGVRTHIHLNGDGNTFPYLLYLAHTLDEVTIENFNGNYIARYAASHGGTAKSITLANITGNWAGANIAWIKGRVGIVTLANITGVYAGANIAEENGRVEIVTLANITGNDVGEYIAGGNGRVGTVTLANITGNWAGANIARDNSRVGIVTLANITGEMAGANIAWNSGRVDLLLAVKNKGKNHLLDNYATRTITTLDGLAKADEIQALIDNLGQQDKAPEHYASASKQLGELLRAQP